MDKEKVRYSQQLYLASQSPRRRMMLAWLGIPFQATSAHLDETPYPDEKPAALVVRLARQKARAVDGAGTEVLVLAADTVVELNERALGKPPNAEAARAMLRRLRAAPHRVHTGVALYAPATGRTITRRVTTTVQMRAYSDAEIEAYLASGDPFDKAGSYAIQHAGFHPVQELACCYANVVGLPLCAVAALLESSGLEISPQLPALCYQHFGYLCPAPDRGILL
ncbi:MAG: Maf family protein [Chloroflexota bacterium]|nr:Maf family protein [Chloroflexota bacterium]